MGSDIASSASRSTRTSAGPSIDGNAPLLQAHLRGGHWIDLMPDGTPGPPESKWCQNRMRPWLCVAPAADAAPGAREAEEFIEVMCIQLL